MNTDELRAIFLFEAFSDEQLAWLIAHSQERTFEAGATLFSEHMLADALWVLLEGQMQITRTLNGRAVIMDTSTQPGNWAGWLPMFDQQPMTLGSHITRPSRVLRIPDDSVKFMLDHGFPVTKHLLSGLLAGVQSFEATSRQQEKMAALGKLSAGLAHELNNPAAAARRAALQMREALQTLQQRLLALCGHDFGREPNAFAAELEQRALERAASATPLGPLEQSDREDALATWLDDHGLAEGWELAPTFASAGIDTDWLDAELGALPAASVGDVAAWLEASLSLHSLIAEIGESTSRISELVKSIKSYTYMDQADVQEIDIHDGIENTLTMLNHKLKHGVDVQRIYDRSLPRITAYPGELNQVWTNIIDNAIDAMAGTGTITITTTRDETCLMIEIADNGPGVPQEIQSRIFEPFFSTKAQGEGSGLGLDIAYRIIASHHHGDIKLVSQPGATRFQVWVPIKHDLS